MESVDHGVDYNTQPEVPVSAEIPAPPESADTDQVTTTITELQPKGRAVSADPVSVPPQPHLSRIRPKLARPLPVYFVTVEAYDQDLDEYFYVIEETDSKTLQWREQVPGNYYFLFGPELQVTAYKHGQPVTQISPLTQRVIITCETCDLIKIKKLP